MTVAALYVDPAGPYPALVPEWYDAERDARTYCGPSPVVAHPPCGPWGKLRMLCTKQDPSLGPVGVYQTLEWGGVLEHPEGSILWDHCGLPAPFHSLPTFAPRVWALVVDQCRWGHPCRKRTWLLFVGIAPADLPPIPAWIEPTHCIDDGSAGDAARKGLKHLPKKQRHITPPAFAAWLVAAAEAAR